ncbi:MAG: hypothetical protein GX275_03315 [Clostridiales bacterium]|nr:hypothetical protein [Clostridiales bacterium]
MVNEIYLVSDKDTHITNYINNAKPNKNGDYRLSKKKINKNTITTGTEGLEYLFMSITA